MLRFGREVECEERAEEDLLRVGACAEEGWWGVAEGRGERGEADMLDWRALVEVLSGFEGEEIQVV